MDWAAYDQLDGYAARWKIYVIAPLWKWMNEVFQLCLLILASLEILFTISGSKFILRRMVTLLMSSVLCAMVLIVLFHGMHIPDLPAVSGFFIAITLDLILAIAAIVLLKNKMSFTREIVTTAKALIDDLLESLFNPVSVDRGRTS